MNHPPHRPFRMGHVDYQPPSTRVPFGNHPESTDVHTSISCWVQWAECSAHPTLLCQVVVDHLRIVPGRRHMSTSVSELPVLDLVHPTLSPSRMPFTMYLLN